MADMQVPTKEFNEMTLVKLLSAALAAVLVVGCSVTNKDVYTPLRQATFQLTSDQGSCSAVVIAREKVLTAAHCDGPNLKFNGKNAVVVKKNEVADLMLLFVPFQECPCVPVGETPAVDSPVVTLGFPLGMSEVATQGKVQDSLIVQKDFPEEVKAIIAHLMLVTSPAVFGNSGGPVFALQNGQWKVVGIMSRVAVAAIGGFIPNIIPHLAMAVNTATVKEFVK